MRKISVSLIAFIIAYLLSGQTEVSGPVSGIWDTVGSPYIAISHIFVESGSILIIDPGVEVIFDGWNKFTINGSLEAIGTENDSIIFTAADTNERWHGIRFINSSLSSIMEYCRVDYGLTELEHMNDPCVCGGGVLCYNSCGDIVISHCLIKNNIAFYGGGISIWNADPQILDCRITHNHAYGSGGGIDMYLGADPIIENTIISNNISNGNGGGLHAFENCSPVILACTITHNTCIERGWKSHHVRWHRDSCFNTKKRNITCQNCQTAINA